MKTIVVKNLIRTFLTAGVFLFIVTFNMSCSPEDGEQGIQGEPGAPGNANVHSKTFQSSEIIWNSQVVFGTNSRVTTLNFEAITPSVVSGGVVMVYGGFLFGGNWTALPFSYYENGNDRHFFFTVQTGSVKIYYNNSANTTPVPPNISFRVVAIEGSLANRMRQNGADFKDYKKVVEMAEEINPALLYHIQE